MKVSERSNRLDTALYKKKNLFFTSDSPVWFVQIQKRYSSKQFVLLQNRVHIKFASLLAPYEDDGFLTALVQSETI